MPPPMMWARFFRCRRGRGVDPVVVPHRDLLFGHVDICLLLNITVQTSRLWPLCLVLNSYDQHMTSAQDRIQQAALRLFGELDRPQVTVSELAEAAGVARGTIYNNVASLDSLFEDVATRLVTEMDTRVIGCVRGDTSDPAQRIADGMRFFVRQAHEDPQWGQFLVQLELPRPPFVACSKELRGPRPPHRDGAGEFQLRTDQLQSAVATMSGAVLAAIRLVLEGHETWRNAGSETAELCLRAFGVPVDRARSIAAGELPPLPGHSRGDT